MMYRDKNIFTPWQEKPDHGVKVESDHECYAFILVPVCDGDNGELAPKYGSVLVAARSPADARVVASQSETRARPDGVAIGDSDLTTNTFSAFRSEKIYSVYRVAEEPVDMPRGVIALEYGGFFA